MNIIEAIIDVLLANIAFVIIIAGGLYSFFKRLADSNQTNKPAPARGDTKRPKQQASPFGVPNAPVDQSKRAITITPEKKRDSKEAISKRYEDLKRKNDSPRYQDKEEAILGTFKADQRELQRAVIWSEILSKPKALQK
ncbi:hypothetical protein [Fictibacillus phosphorivorans]|uniref:hypothetical protein n=1 Tax=Fictibacillus phosphorivorans TaxID=1221500 RepID=UPI00203A6535|nr:hypothetical protein [Fictibacillus phosphorivorans]MCM3716870.1 hypothetical protein [Fictibacillus phosphorivorans]MCM3774581.1 hypothetical protein [Fictibacillus phosphorivorans]